MATAARHNELVDFIMNEIEGMETDKLREQALLRFGDFTFDELDKATLDAAGRLREEAAEARAHAAELERFMPIFEGEGSGNALLIDIARRKAAAGDKLAAEFVRWASE